MLTFSLIFTLFVKNYILAALTHLLTKLFGLGYIFSLFTYTGCYLPLDEHAASKDISPPL